MKSQNKFKEFLPDSRNLGGKRNIESQQKNHLLALVNIKPTINTQKQPHKHVNAKYKSQKKQIQKFDEFKEVDEAFRRVNQLKKGGINNTAPQTMQRTAFMKNRIPIGKNIVMQDHSRNIKALLGRLDDVEKTHQKKVTNIKNLKYVNMNNSRMQNSQYTSGNSILRRSSNNSFSRQNIVQPKQFNNYFAEEVNNNAINQNQRFLEQNGLYEQQNDDIDEKIQQNIQNQEIYDDMYDQYESDQPSEDFKDEDNLNQNQNQNIYEENGQNKNYQNIKHKVNPSNALDMSEGQQFLGNDQDYQNEEEIQNNNFSIHSNSLREFSQFSEFDTNQNDKQYQYQQQQHEQQNQQQQIKRYQYRAPNQLQLNNRPVQKYNVRPQSAKPKLNQYNYNNNKTGFSQLNSTKNQNNYNSFNQNNLTHQPFYQQNSFSQLQQQFGNNYNNNSNKYNIPYIPKRQIGDPYRELKRAILNIVMEQNLFDKNIIKKDLAQTAKKVNSHLKKQMIQEICNQICYNLFGSL